MCGKGQGGFLQKVKTEIDSKQGKKNVTLKSVGWTNLKKNLKKGEKNHLVM